MGGAALRTWLGEWLFLKEALLSFLSVADITLTGTLLSGQGLRKVPHLQDHLL